VNRLLAVVVIFALCLISPAFAHADSFSSANVVGTITPGAPADGADVATYINNLISLGLGQSDTFSGQNVTRSNNDLGSLPNAVFLNSGTDLGTGTTIDLGAGGADTYLFAKYDGQNDESLVWDVANESGTITIPINGPLGHGLSGWILFGPSSSPSSVPEPSSLILLGIGALGFFGPVRRKLLG
jgi:hypothetical protein